MLLAKAGGESAASIAVRLGHHLDWFLWDEQTRRSDADRADTLSGQAATGSYDNTRFALAREPQPLWSYWEDELAMPTVVQQRVSQSVDTSLPPRLSTTVQQCTRMPQNGSERPF